MLRTVTIFCPILAGAISTTAHAEAISLTANIGETVEAGNNNRGPQKITSITTIVNGGIGGWDLSMAVSYDRAPRQSRFDEELARISAPDPLRPADRIPTANGLTDVKISLERSVPLAKSVNVDLLVRATLPTGKKENYLGAGRYELLADVGLSTKMEKATIWAGVARRFRTEGYDEPGRDINELYAGIHYDLDARHALRFDYLRAQSPYAGEKNDRYLSASFIRNLASGASVQMSARQNRDIYGRDRLVMISYSLPLRNFV